MHHLNKRGIKYTAVYTAMSEEQVSYHGNTVKTKFWDASLNWSLWQPQKKILKTLKLGLTFKLTFLIFKPFLIGGLVHPYHLDEFIPNVVLGFP